VNGPNDEPTKRFLEQEVELRRTGQKLRGTRFYFYPVDEPPVIEVKSVDRQWYQEVWEQRGWEVHS
jgi:hypothetical protein